MEQPLDYRDNDNLTLENEGKAALKTASKWAKFVAIFGIIFCSLALVGTLVSLGGFGLYSAMNPLIMTIYMAVIILACVWVLQFANKASSAIKESNSGDLTASFRYLRNLFILQGVLSILMLIAIIGIIVFAISLAGNL